MASTALSSPKLGQQSRYSEPSYKLIFTVSDVLHRSIAEPVAMSSNVTQNTADPGKLSDAWETARNRFCESLDPNEQALFNEADVQNLYYQTSNAERADQETSKAQRTIAKIKPFVDRIQEYGSAMDVFASIYPIGIAPIWGVIRVLLVTAQCYSNFYKKITDVLCRIGELLPKLKVCSSISSIYAQSKSMITTTQLTTWKNYQRLFGDCLRYPEFHEALTCTFVDIITLCRDFRSAFKAQGRSVWGKVKRLALPLHNGLEDAESKFYTHSKNLKEGANICHMLEAKEANELIVRNAALQEMNAKG